eukprot:42126-Eustigmatos_ZCMA.PRE.1
MECDVRVNSRTTRRYSCKMPHALLVMLAVPSTSLTSISETCFPLFHAGVTQRCLRQSQEGAVHAARHCSRLPRVQMLTRADRVTDCV